MAGDFPFDWPKDMYHVLSKKLRETATPDSHLMFADDVQGLSKGERYAVGVSHVPIEEFIQHHRPNGTLKANLRWTRVSEPRTMTRTLAHQLLSVYPAIPDVAGIYICSGFNPDLVRYFIRTEGKSEFRDEMMSKVYVAGSHTVNERQCRFYRYKQAVGEELRHLLINL